MVCALGFSHHIQDLPEIIEIVGFDSYDTLAQERNGVFATDIYQRLSIKDVLVVNLHGPGDMQKLSVMQYLFIERLNQIESRIEATVNSIIIERYNRERQQFITTA